MKFIFILVFSLVFCGFSVAQQGTGGILIETNNFSNSKKISLYGSDSLDIRLKIEQIKENATWSEDVIWVEDVITWSEGNVITFSGKNIYLLEKFVNKYFEWLDLAKQKGLLFEKDMFNKNLISDAEAYTWKDREGEFTQDSICSDNVYIRASAEFSKYGISHLGIKAKTETSHHVYVSFNDVEMLELKKLFDSDKFKNEVNKIYQWKNLMDEFEPIEIEED